MTPKGNARFEQALALHQQGQLHEALALYQALLAQHPQHADALNMQGAALYQLQQYPQAEQALAKAVALTPQSASAHTHLSLTLKALGQRSAAIAHAQTALKLAPRLPQAHNNLGILWHDGADYRQAIDCYEQALALDPQFAQAHFNLANALHDSQALAEALPHYERACSIDPRYTQAWFNWGNTLSKLGQYQASLRCYEHTLQLAPQHAQALNNLGNALRELTHYAQAQQCYELAVHIDAHYVEAQLNLAYVLLLTGQWQRAWPLYENRWQLAKTGLVTRQWTSPQWDGSASLRGKTIVLHAEQGFGDTLQFCRFATVLHDQGARVLLEVPAPLVALMRSVPGVQAVFAFGEPLPAYDWHCPLLSLPLALQLTSPTVTISPYVQADPIKTQAWQARWQAHDRWHVGLTFSGSSTHLHDHYRSIALNTLAAQLPTHYQGRAIQYVSLQKEYRPHDLAALSSAGVIDVSASLHDFSDTAALCASMDHIISVDTSVAHLAGALGQPLSLLLPLVPDWRWGTTTDDGAWYPSARLYRQSIKNDWSHPLAVLQDAWRSSSTVMKLKA